ncbi:sodium:calcium antiporter [Candidatus Falkowbacteria bacterium]|nr:sodium:calcium antiporter [Candidatus Falkowbacteria bacterium]
MLIQVLILIISLAAVVFSANYLVSSSTKIARQWNVSEMFIGLTIVAIGTSAPEISISILAALKGQGDLSVANVIGSNVFNLGFILGLLAIIVPQLIPKKIVYRDSVFLLAVTIIVLVFMADMRIVIWEGLVLLGVLIGYLVFLAIKRDAFTEASGKKEKVLAKDYLIFLVSLAVLIKSSDFTVSSAVYIAEYFKISAWAIGATVVAAGTSLPELATSIVALMKKKFALSVGNVIGSSIFNTLGVIGFSSFIAPITLYSKGYILGVADLMFSAVLLVAMILLLIIFMRTGWKLSRREGVVLFFLAILWLVFEFYIGKA